MKRLIALLLGIFLGCVSIPAMAATAQLPKEVSLELSANGSKVILSAMPDQGQMLKLTLYEDPDVRAQWFVEEYNPLLLERQSTKVIPVKNADGFNKVFTFQAKPRNGECDLILICRHRDKPERHPYLTFKIHVVVKKADIPSGRR